MSSVCRSRFAGSAGTKAFFFVFGTLAAEPRPTASVSIRTAKQ